jgi:hypothetical protein
MVVWSKGMSKISTQSILWRSIVSIGSCMTFLAVTAMPSRSHTTAIDRQPVPKLAATKAPKPNLPTALEILRTAAGLQGRALGATARPSKLYQAFEQSLQAVPNRPNLERLLREATPAGGIYAAMLLVKLDPKAGRQALDQMRSDQTPLTVAVGCTTMKTTVGAAVDDILQGRSGVFPPLP